MLRYREYEGLQQCNIGIIYDCMDCDCVPKMPLEVNSNLAGFMTRFTGLDRPDQLHPDKTSANQVAPTGGPIQCVHHIDEGRKCGGRMVGGRRAGERGGGSQGRHQLPQGSGVRVPERR